MNLTENERAMILDIMDDEYSNGSGVDSRPWSWSVVDGSRARAAVLSSLTQKGLVAGNGCKGRDAVVCFTAEGKVIAGEMLAQRDAAEKPLFEMAAQMMREQAEERVFDTDDEMLDACADHLKGRKVHPCPELEDEPAADWVADLAQCATCRGTEKRWDAATRCYRCTACNSVIWTGPQPKDEPVTAAEVPYPAHQCGVCYGSGLYAATPRSKPVRCKNCGGTGRTDTAPVHAPAILAAEDLIERLLRLPREIEQEAMKLADAERQVIEERFSLQRTEDDLLTTSAALIDGRNESVRAAQVRAHTLSQRLRLQDLEENLRAARLQYDRAKNEFSATKAVVRLLEGGRG